jgi:glycosyltransferase involved in cell wall biosynthesis
MTTRPVFIVSSWYGPPWNEGEKNIARALELGLPDHGFSARVYSDAFHDVTRRAHHRPSPARIAGRLRFWAAAALTARREGATIVHLLTSVSSALGLKAAVIRTLSGASLVLHVTGLSSPVRGYRILLRADRVLVGGAYLRPLFPGAIEVPPISPNMNPEGADEPPRAVGAPRRLLYLGSMEPVRGVHTLIDALAAVRAAGDGNGWHLTIAWNGVGDPRYAAHVRTQIAERGLEDVVRWDGVAMEVGALYRGHDIVVIPRASRERMGFPLRLVEAFSFGSPVVVSDVGEMPAVTRGCGLVFRRGDPAGLASALSRLMSDPALHAECARHARERAREYAPARTIGRVAAVYRELDHGG